MEASVFVLTVLLAFLVLVVLSGLFFGLVPAFPRPAGDNDLVVHDHVLLTIPRYFSFTKNLLQPGVSSGSLA